MQKSMGDTPGTRRAKGAGRFLDLARRGSIGVRTALGPAAFALRQDRIAVELAAGLLVLNAGFLFAVHRRDWLMMGVIAWSDFWLGSLLLASRTMLVTGALCLFLLTIATVLAARHHDWPMAALALWALSWTVWFTQGVHKSAPHQGAP
jgi:hypothetical protein